MNIKVIDKISTGENNYEKKVKLKEILDNQLDKYYPCDLIEIDSLRKLQQKIKVARITIIEWVKEYLHGRYGSTTYLNKYNEIWTSRGFHSRRQVDDSKFKLFIEIMEFAYQLAPADSVPSPQSQTLLPFNYCY